MGPPGAPGLEVSVAGPQGRWDFSALSELCADR